MSYDKYMAEKWRTKTKDVPLRSTGQILAAGYEAKPSPLNSGQPRPVTGEATRHQRSHQMLRAQRKKERPAKPQRPRGEAKSAVYMNSE